MRTPERPGESGSSCAPAAIKLFSPLRTPQFLHMLSVILPVFSLSLLFSFTFRLIFITLLLQ